MKLTQLRSIGLLLMSLWLISASQSAFASSFQSYAKDAYYLGALGGKPPTLAEFANNPRAFVRSEFAYQSLKQKFEITLSRSLNDAEFQALLASDQVRAELKCEGKIRTSAIDKAGNIKWLIRDCYLKEYLIEVSVDNEWYVVASQGCFNLVRPEVEPIPVVPQPEVVPENPPLIVTSEPLRHSPKVLVQETRGITVHLCNCPGNHRCHNDIYLPGYRAILIR
jgi:hypothetical protein